MEKPDRSSPLSLILLSYLEIFLSTSVSRGLHFRHKVASFSACVHLTWARPDEWIVSPKENKSQATNISAGFLEKCYEDLNLKLLELIRDASAAELRK